MSEVGKLSPEALEQLSFNELIVQRIGEIAVPEPVRDPYERPRVGVPIRMGGIVHHRDGRLEFSAEYDTRRVWIGQEFELIYSYLGRIDRAELYIHEFAPEGGLQARTVFSQYDRPHVYKSWVGRSFGGFTDDNSLYFGRELKAREEADVNRVASNPLAHVALLAKIVKISPKEQKQIDANEKRRQESNEKLRKGLDAIDRARRRAWQDADRIILG